MAEREPGSREGEFLRLWTRHEAELKRRGPGIGSPKRASAPARAAVAHSAAVDSEPARRAAPEIVELDVGSHAAAALALSCPTNELRLWEWT
jgi:phosphopantetheinyl transferase